MSANPQRSRTAVLSARHGAGFQITPLGALSESTLAELGEVAARCMEQHPQELLLDLVRVQTLNSAALETLVDIQERIAARGGRLRLSNANPLVLEILHLTGIEHRISVARAEEGDTAELEGRKRLGDILIARGLLNQGQLDEALKIQRESDQRLGEVLIDKGWLSEQDVLRALSTQLSIPDVKLRQGVFDPAVAKLMDARDIKRLKVFPLFRVHDELTLATTNPQNVPCLREVENLTRCSVRPVLARQEDILAVLDNSDGYQELTTDFISEVDDDFEVVEGLPQDLDAIDEAASASPVINLVNSLIQRAVREGASDVHIEPFRDRCRVRYRIDGVLYEVMTLKPELHPSLVSRLKVMANLDISERRLPQDGRVQVITQGRPVDLRFSSLPGLHGEKVVLRILDKNRAILELDRLGMSKRNLGNYRQLLECGYGLVLVTGPTGSGKTTSLYAALNHLKSIEKNIVTIEDPVEYQLDIINQNEVRANIGLSFAKILKHVLRQDPDIIMVGEIRERETAEIAVQSALTGHLVLSTLHTNDSIGAVTRMIDMGVEPYLLSSALIGVVAQRLVRTICPACKTTYMAAPDLVARFGWDPQQRYRLARGRGCEECYDSGYKGRIAIHETLPVTPELQSLIVSNPSRDQLADYLQGQKVELLFDDGLQRVREQLTTPEEVARVINS